MAVVEVGVTLLLIGVSIARLIWVEGTDGGREVRNWRRRHAFDVVIVVASVMFAVVVVTRFLTIG